MDFVEILLVIFRERSLMIFFYIEVIENDYIIFYIGWDLKLFIKISFLDC